MSGRLSYLGEFEQIVLLAVARLTDDAHGMRLRGEIAARTGRAVSIGAMYSTLDRLVGKAYLSTSERTVEGRPRRFFALTRAGVDALEAARALQEHMWAGIDLKKSEPRA